MKVVAHRGDATNFPENTIKAFIAALENGANAIELDVHFTKDKKIVVHHDYYLHAADGTSNLIYEKNLSYAKQITLKSHAIIPTLEEVFISLGNKLDYEIELKGFTLEFLEATLRLVKEFKLENYVEFTSPLSQNLSSLLKLDSTVKTGIFIPRPPDWMDKDLAQTLAIQSALLGNNKVLHCPLPIIDRKFVERAHVHDLLVHAADCNTATELKQALNSRVDQISTDKLTLAAALQPLKV